jgi:hypothetical protein
LGRPDKRMGLPRTDHAALLPTTSEQVPVEGQGLSFFDEVAANGPHCYYPGESDPTDKRIGPGGVLGSSSSGRPWEMLPAPRRSVFRKWPFLTPMRDALLLTEPRGGS